MAQSVERILGKDEVIGSIPIISSSYRPANGCLTVHGVFLFSISYAAEVDFSEMLC